MADSEEESAIENVADKEGVDQAEDEEGDNRETDDFEVEPMAPIRPISFADNVNCTLNTTSASENAPESSKKPMFWIWPHGCKKTTQLKRT